MPAAEIRKRKTATDASDVDTVAEVKIVTTDEVAIIDSDEPKAKLALVRWVKESIYNELFFPFWKHLDDRGFGTPQPFICWLLIPFTLSMIVWYYSVIELMDMANWESRMGPAHEYIPEEPFTWGEL